MAESEWEVISCTLISATNQLPLSPVQIQPSPPYYRQPSQDDGRKVYICALYQNFCSIVPLQFFTFNAKIDIGIILEWISFEEAPSNIPQRCRFWNRSSWNYATLAYTIIAHYSAAMGVLNGAPEAITSKSHVDTRQSNYQKSLSTIHRLVRLVLPFRARSYPSSAHSQLPPWDSQFSS